MKRPRVPLLNLSGIRCRSTSKVAAQSYHKESINNGAVRLADFLNGCLDIDILSYSS